VSDTDLAVRMSGITKSFNGIRVLDNVNFELRRGEVHALVGGNGAGKSTLMKILEGVYSADGGTIEVDGAPVQIHSPEDARRYGIGMVFQEFSLIPTLTVAQNIFLTREPRSSSGFLDDREAERLARDLFKQLEVDIDPDATMAYLSTGYWQLTEIAKALSQHAKILILDEPTSSLTASETESLFSLIDRLQRQGISIIYISHRMEEIFRVADRVTVLRDGRLAITAPVADITLDQVIEQIVGKKMEQSFVWKERRVDRSGTPLLEVIGLASGRRVHDVSFKLYAGEILGLAGLMGSGRTELARALFGIDRISAGTVKVRGLDVTIRTPDDALAAGISLVPEDRRLQGLVLDHTIKDNLLLPQLGRLQRGGVIDDQKGNELVASFVKSLRVRTDSIFRQVRLLSGGNQQKVVIAKWLAYEPDILIMDEPTAGIDIGAKTEIMDVIRSLADQGKGVVVISSELTELLAVADRVVVLRNGISKRELMRQEIDTEELLHNVVQTA
jgi:ribose transport system ATP-binding protein